jgi:hypothetical protein
MLSKQIFSHACAGAALVSLWMPLASASTLRTFVTGEAGSAHVVFSVDFDPAVAGSAILGIAVIDSLRLDGIDFTPGSTSVVAVGAQGFAGGGAITQYNVSTGTILSAFVPDTDAVAASPTRPSTVATDGSNIYYIENQFGFAGTTHRIMRTPAGGPPGTAIVVFDGAASGALGLARFEGIEIVGGRLYFFAADHLAPGSRALYSIALTAGGLWSGATPVHHLGGLSAAPAGDGSDELDYDPFTGRIYGTNIITGEVIYWDPVGGTGGYLISPGDITGAAPGSSLSRMGTSMLDGIRTTGDGYLILSGLEGVLLTLDLAGIGSGLDSGDVRILFDDAGAGRVHFDDLSPVIESPEPGPAALVAAGFAALLCRRRWAAA